MDKTKTKRITITLPFDLYQKIKKMAKDQRCSMSSVIVALLKKNLDSSAHSTA